MRPRLGQVNGNFGLLGYYLRPFFAAPPLSKSLIIAEKPSVAADIARAIGGSDVENALTLGCNDFGRAHMAGYSITRSSLESQRRLRDGSTTTQRRKCSFLSRIPEFLAETDGFEPSMHVFARMLP